MLKVTVDGQVYEYEPNRLMNTEAIALQKETGFTPPDFGEALEKGDAVAITGLVWLLWRRSGRHLKFADCEFNMMDIQIESDEDDEEDGAARPTTDAADAEAGRPATSKRGGKGTSSNSPTTST